MYEFISSVEHKRRYFEEYGLSIKRLTVAIDFQGKKITKSKSMATVNGLVDTGQIWNNLRMST